MQDAALELAVLRASRFYEAAGLFSVFVLLETRQKEEGKKK